MYIPHEIGDKVYFFQRNTIDNKLMDWVITKITVNSEWTLFEIDSNKIIDRLFIELKSHEFYPSKAVAKEELLRRAVHYANESLIDI